MQNKDMKIEDNINQMVSELKTAFDTYLFGKDLMKDLFIGLLNGSLRSFEVYGHSMEPTFYPRDIVVCRLINNLDCIRNKEVYAIITKREGVITKRVIKKGDYLELHGDNSEFEPYQIHLSEIHQVWKFETRISKFASLPQQNY